MGLFRKKSPRPPAKTGAVWHCSDPRNWSSGQGGEHFVVLLAREEGTRWRVAVIETDPEGRVYTIDDKRSGLVGGIRLNPDGKLDLVDESQLLTFKCNFGLVLATRIDEALGQALLDEEAASADEQAGE